MSLFDSVIGALGNAQGGGGADPLQALTQMLGQAGGLGGVLQKLQHAGLGDAVASWVSTGANQPVAPDALQQALGGDAVAGFARQLGIDPGMASGLLAQLLPQVVDRLTPHGQVPEGGFGGFGDIGSALGSLMGGTTGGAGGAGGMPGAGGDLAGMLGGLLGRR